MPTNDNETPLWASAVPDPHGHAALLLVESLIHGLCEKSVLTTEEAIEITERATAIEAEHAQAADGAGAPLWRAHALLSLIAASFRSEGLRSVDGLDGSPSPRPLA